MEQYLKKHKWSVCIQSSKQHIMGPKKQKQAWPGSALQQEGGALAHPIPQGCILLLVIKPYRHRSLHSQENRRWRTQMVESISKNIMQRQNPVQKCHGGIHEQNTKGNQTQLMATRSISFYFYENAQHNISISKFYGTIKRTQIIVLILLRLNSSESK